MNTGTSRLGEPGRDHGMARAWGWVGHLSEGGTSSWLEWTGEASARARVLPGAQQLELLRRVNLANSALSTDRPADFRLAERILSAAAPGRGKPDLPLLGAVAPTFGPQPVDPSGLPADELIRVATSVLAEDVVAIGVSEPQQPRRRPWPLNVHRGYRVAGDPLAAASVRAHLTSRGRPPGGVGSQSLILGGPLDQMLADVWTRRCFERGSGGWLEWLRFWRQRGELPPRIDLPAVAERHQAQREHVQVVLDDSRLPRLLGVRTLPLPERPGADSAELARRIATVLGLLVPPEERAMLMTHTVRPRMPLTGVPAVSVPVEHRDWVSAAAERMARQLSRAGYPVVGDPTVVVPTQWSSAGPTRTQGDEVVLTLAVRMLVDQDWKKEPR